MTPATGQRIVISADAATTESLIAALGSSHRDVIRMPRHPHAFRPGPWPAIEESLRRFEYRVSQESRRTSFLSCGSVLDDWAELHTSLHRHSPRSHRDAAFARRYAAMFATTAARHARCTYTLCIHIPTPEQRPDDDLTLLAAIKDAGLPLIATADATSALAILAGDQTTGLGRVGAIA
ncbi:hypothetical protein HH308_11080 [Gordonia sp. TBRC 11910]|uniref:Uncharacterized protein n=1 Tax=Gordonia asplenii TaxID=2725283 RepID=A0A848L278_9ACTN|nr:hypothetical protein [Gordonia asplenii]NMO01758.1 hypothetical protein [Gordonia asplenii]